MKSQDGMLVVGGGFFVLIGLTMTFIFLGADLPSEMRIFVVVPILFLIIGGVMVGRVIYKDINTKRTRKNGKKYSAKIYGYCRDTSVMVNNEYPVDTKVHFFDQYGIEREVVLHTAFTSGSYFFPIGMTIDIFEHNGEFTYDAKSLRHEILPREEELMDDKPIEPEKVKMVAITCKGCGASFQATLGYSNRCPYCGGYMNA